MWYQTPPRSSPYDATKTSLSTAIINDNMDITSDTTYDAWTYDSIHHAYVHNNSTAIINGYKSTAIIIIQLYHIVSYLHIIPYNPKKGTITTYDHKHHIHHSTTIHTSSRNNINLFIKGS